MILLCGRISLQAMDVFGLEPIHATIVFAVLLQVGLGYAHTNPFEDNGIACTKFCYCDLLDPLDD